MNGMSLGPVPKLWKEPAMAEDAVDRELVGEATSKAKCSANIGFQKP